jgi:hypothetical protein
MKPFITLFIASFCKNEEMIVPPNYKVKRSYQLLDMSFTLGHSIHQFLYSAFFWCCWMITIFFFSFIYFFNVVNSNSRLYSLFTCASTINLVIFTWETSHNFQLFLIFWFLWLFSQHLVQLYHTYLMQNIIALTSCKPCEGKESEVMW